MAVDPSLESMTRRLHAAVADREKRYLELLAELVAIDSGSTDPEGVNNLGQVVAAVLRGSGWTVDTTPLPQDTEAGPVGDLLVARRPGRRSRDNGGRRVLLLAHLDTVFERGEAARRPFSITDGIAHGPGVCDDKSGIAAAIVATEACVEEGVDDWAELVLALTPDEELGSPASRDEVAALGAQADAALCLEAARANGDLVSARKGAADLVIEVTGRAAHAGIEPEKGAHAVLAAARMIEHLQALGGWRPGVTCNVGAVNGGRRPNVVPDAARLVVDVRAETTADFDATLDRLREIVATEHVAGTSAAMRLISQAPPMERTAGTDAMLGVAERIGAVVGVAVRHASTGGAADANTVAAQGTPTLDGVGPIGGNDHAPTEYLEVASIVPRVTMLAGLMAEVGSGRVALTS